MARKVAFKGSWAAVVYLVTYFFCCGGAGSDSTASVVAGGSMAESSSSEVVLGIAGDSCAESGDLLRLPLKTIIVPVIFRNQILVKKYLPS